jgi:putative toxin-antitoxin system antitoxin component (TIGR02293 family)
VTPLYLLLGLKEQPANGLAWHAIVHEGLPYRGIKNVARALAVREADVAEWLGLRPAMLVKRRNARRLDALESDLLYRLARAWRALLVPLGDEKAAGQWLRTLRPELRDKLPMDLLHTTLGTEFVMTAIARIAPVDKTIVYADAPDYEVGLAAEQGRNPHVQVQDDDAVAGEEDEELEGDPELAELHEDRVLEEVLARSASRGR